MARKKSRKAVVVAPVADTIETCHGAWCQQHPGYPKSEYRLHLQRLQIEDAFGHKNGTAPTHAAAKRRREGTLARLYMSGAISLGELGAAEEIAAAAERIGSVVGVRTMSMETRVDGGGFGDGSFWEGLGQVRREIAYRRWRADLGKFAGAIEDLIIRDIGLVETAAAHRMGVRRLRGMLVQALGAWGSQCRWARDWVNDDDLARAHARIA